MNITIKELPAREVAYVRHVGHYLETGAAWGQLFQWAVAHQLLPPNQQLIGISLDNPEQVAADAFRYDACVTIPADFEKGNHPGLQFQTLPRGLYARYAFFDTPDQLSHAFQALYGQWLPASEYEADDRPNLELSLNNPADDPEGKCRVDLYIAVRKRG